MAKNKQYVPGNRTAQQNKAIHDKAQEMMKNVVERGTGKDIYSKRNSVSPRRTTDP